MSFDKEFHFYDENCFLLKFVIISIFYFNDKRLDGMCGCHSIWRRWGRYQGVGLVVFSEAENVDVPTMYKIMHKQ